MLFSDKFSPPLKFAQSPKLMAVKDKIILIQDYLNKIKSASKEFTKREAFKDLLNRLYAADPETSRIIDAITMGAETNIEALKHPAIFIKNNSCPQPEGCGNGVFTIEIF